MKIEVVCQEKSSTIQWKGGFVQRYQKQGIKNILIGFIDCGKETNGGIVGQKDLAPQTVALGNKMAVFVPDDS